MTIQDDVSAADIQKLYVEVNEFYEAVNCLLKKVDNKLERNFYFYIYVTRLCTNVD